MSKSSPPFAMKVCSPLGLLSLPSVARLLLALLELSTGLLSVLNI